MLFSRELIDLYHEIEETTEPTQRFQLMLDLANMFTYDADETNHNVSEEVHNLVSDVIENRTIYEKTAMTLARVIMRSVPGFLEEHQDPTTVEIPVPEKPKSN